MSPHRRRARSRLPSLNLSAFSSVRKAIYCFHSKNNGVLSIAHACMFKAFGGLSIRPPNDAATVHEC